MKKFFKVCFIGAGNMSEEHIKVFNRNKKTKLAGIYSRTKSKCFQLAKKYNIPLITDTIEELYFKTQADLVVIAVSETSTKQICKKCFKFKWKCLVEKPIGINLKQSLEILKLSKIYNSKIFIALNRRHYSSTNILLEKLKKEKTKKIITIIDQQDINIAKKYNKSNIVLKNYMYANSIHLIDFLTFLSKGKINKVKNSFSWKFLKTDFMSSKIEYSNGDIAYYFCYWNRPGPWQISVSTKKTFFNLSPLETISFKDHESNKVNYFITKKYDKEFKPGLWQQTNEIIKALENKKNKMPTINDAILTMKLVNKIYKY